MDVTKAIETLLDENQKAIHPFMIIYLIVSAYKRSDLGDVEFTSYVIFLFFKAESERHEFFKSRKEKLNHSIDHANLAECYRKFLRGDLVSVDVTEEDRRYIKLIYLTVKVLLNYPKSDLYDDRPSLRKAHYYICHLDGKINDLEMKYQTFDKYWLIYKPLSSLIYVFYRHYEDLFHIDKISKEFCGAVLKLSDDQFMLNRLVSESLYVQNQLASILGGYAMPPRVLIKYPENLKPCRVQPDPLPDNFRQRMKKYRAK